MRPSRRQFLKYGTAVVAGASVVGSHATGASAMTEPATGRALDVTADPWDRVPEILGRIKPPTFAGRAFPITRYGAVGDGVTDCTQAFRAAVAACNQAGGGRVIVPEGSFLTGAIHLLSNVELHLVPAATVKFSTDPADYLPVVFTRWEGTECFNYSPFIYAFGQENVAVTGRGLLDGQGLAGEWETWYRDSSRQGPDQRELRRMGEEGVPVEQRVFGAGHFLRPQLMQFYRCRNVLVSDVTIHEPAMWTVHPVLSTNVTIRDITVVSTLFNTDGVDIECCSDVHVVGGRFDTTDDCVVLKAGRDADGHRVGVPSENVVVERCKFSGRWGGIAVGSEMSGGVRNVFARDCEINPPDFPGAFPIKYPLYIKTNKLRGGFIHDVHLRGFTGGDVERNALHVILNYNNQIGTRPVDVRGIVVDGMVLDGIGQQALHFEGLETDPIRDVHISNTHLTGVRNEVNLLSHVEGLVLADVTVNGKPAVT
jgi:polygalacturonase